MATKCFTCGIGFDEIAILRLYSDIYKRTGIEVFYYRVSATAPLMISEAEPFKEILKNEIKPNIRKGANYESIKNFR